MPSNKDGNEPDYVYLVSLAYQFHCTLEELLSTHTYGQIQIMAAGLCRMFELQAEAAKKSENKSRSRFGGGTVETDKRVFKLPKKMTTSQEYMDYLDRAGL